MSQQLITSETGDHLLQSNVLPPLPSKTGNRGKELSLLYLKRQIIVKTCGDIYDHWRARKRHYKKAPRDGVEFQIDYIDTGSCLPESFRDSAPVVLVLHGAPGSYQDFTLLIEHLRRDNARVIAPNFPEYKTTVEEKVLFRHSADEKAAYLRDFLTAINVTKIDLLVSHSSAIFPTLLILLNANNHDKTNRTAVSKNDQITECPTINGSVVSVCEDQSKVLTQRETSVEPGEDILQETQDELFEDARNELDSDLSELNVDVNNNNDHSDDENSQTTRTMDCDDDSNTGILGHVGAAAVAVESSEMRQDPRGEQTNLETDFLRAQEIRKKLERDMKTRKKTRNQEPLVKFEQQIEIRAVALFNPAGHRLPKSMKPTWFKCGSVHCYQHKIGRYWFRKLGPAFLTIVGVPVKVDNMDNVMLSATVMRNSKCGRVMSQLEQLSQLKVPTLLVFSENDKLIEKEIFYEMTTFMNLDPKTFDIFNNEGSIERSQSHPNDWIRVMVFKAGGHYAYSNYAKTVNEAVSQLLAKTTSCPSTND